MKRRLPACSCGFTDKAVTYPIVFSAPPVSYCIGGPWRALSPRVGPLLRYLSVFLALCQQPVPSRAFPLAARPDTGCPPCSIQPSVCAPDRPKHTISLASFTAAAAVVVAQCGSGVSDSLLFVERLYPQLSESDSRIVSFTESPASASSLQRLFLPLQCAKLNTIPSGI